MKGGKKRCVRNHTTDHNAPFIPFRLVVDQRNRSGPMTSDNHKITVAWQNWDQCFITCASTPIPLFLECGYFLLFGPFVFCIVDGVCVLPAKTSELVAWH